MSTTHIKLSQALAAARQLQSSNDRLRQFMTHLAAMNVSLVAENDFLRRGVQSDQWLRSEMARSRAKWGE